MTMNVRQEELLHEYIRNILEHFPSVRVLDYHGSPYSDGEIWVEVAVPDEETVLTLGEFTPKEEMQILVNYGYSFSLLPHIAEQFVKHELSSLAVSDLV